MIWIWFWFWCGLFRCVCRDWIDADADGLTVCFYRWIDEPMNERIDRSIDRSINQSRACRDWIHDGLYVCFISLIDESIS